MAADGRQPVEIVGTYARRVGDDVHLQLQLPEAGELPAPTLQLRNRRSKVTVEAPATVLPAPTGCFLTATVPVKQLRGSLWRVWMQPDQASRFHRLDARLLINEKQPIALLTGPEPSTEMAPPRPRPTQAEVQGAPQPRAQQLAGQAVNRILSWLPEDRAARYRAKLSQVARRVRL